MFGKQTVYCFFGTRFTVHMESQVEDPLLVNTERTAARAEIEAQEVEDVTTETELTEGNVS